MNTATAKWVSCKAFNTEMSKMKVLFPYLENEIKLLTGNKSIVYRKMIKAWSTHDFRIQINLKTPKFQQQKLSTLKKPCYPNNILSETNDRSWLCTCESFLQTYIFELSFIFWITITCTVSHYSYLKTLKYLFLFTKNFVGFNPELPVASTQGK